jgi:hypothetical protein
VSGWRESHSGVVGQHGAASAQQGGDRRLTITRMTHAAETCNYVEKRRAQGKTGKEIRRCVKRLLVRRVFRILNAGARVKKVQEAVRQTEKSRSLELAAQGQRTAALGQFKIDPTTPSGS